MVDFRDIISNLQDWGFFDVVLPFLLVYVVVFAILERAQIFKIQDGSDKENAHVKNVNAIIAFVFGLFVVASLQTVRYIQDLIINVVLIIIFILVALIVLGFIFGNKYMELFYREEGKKKGITALGYTLVTVFGIATILILMWVLGWLEPVLDYFDNAGGIEEGTISTVLFLAAIAGVLFWITRGGGSNSGSGGDSEQ